MILQGRKGLTVRVLNVCCEAVIMLVPQKLPVLHTADTTIQLGPTLISTVSVSVVLMSQFPRQSQTLIASA